MVGYVPSTGQIRERHVPARRILVEKPLEKVSHGKMEGDGSMTLNGSEEDSL